MIFAPVIRRTAFAATPRSADLALQRFVLASLAQPASPRAQNCTVSQDDKALTLQLDVPGLARDQLQIEIDANVVRLRSVDGAPRQVQRAWELPHAVDAAASTAKLENGVLTLTLAKVQPASQATTLTIH